MSLDLFETFENVDIDKMTCEDIVTELKKRRDLSEAGIQKMVVRSNLRLGDINVAPKMMIMIYTSIKDLDNSTHPVYTSEQDRPENKTTIRTIKEELAKNVIDHEHDDEEY